MKCDTCGHDDYTISNTTGANPLTVSFNVTITTGPATQMPTYQFHLDCECCKNNHNRFRIAEAR